MNDCCEGHVCNTEFSGELVCAAVAKAVCGSLLNRAEMIDFASVRFIYEVLKCHELCKRLLGWPCLVI